MRLLNIGLLGFFCLAFSASAQVDSESLIHDRSLEEFRRLQVLDEALPSYTADSQQRPNWVEILKQGIIKPRETLNGEVREIEPMGAAPVDGIVFAQTLAMPHVVFPHQAHTEWLACRNCHDALFERKRTGRGMGMEAILAGRHCGVCHGRVAFSPEGSCYRCHTLQHAEMSIQAQPDVDPARVSETASDASEIAEDTPRKRRRSGQPATRKSPVYPAKPQ